MNRRSFLSAGLVALAGCSATDAPGQADAVPGGSTSTETPTPEVTPEFPSPEGDSDLLFEFKPDRTDATVEVGDEDEVPGTDRSHGLVVWNDAAVSRTLELRVRDRLEGSTSVDDVYEVSPGGSVSVSFVEPSDYVVDVRVRETGTGASTTVRSGQIDCNASGTYLRIAPDGGFTSSSFSTMMGCPSHREEA